MVSARQVPERPAGALGEWMVGMAGDEKLEGGARSPRAEHRIFGFDRPVGIARRERRAYRLGRQEGKAERQAGPA